MMNLPDVDVASGATAAITYPRECTASVVLADGSLARIRAIRPDDTARLHAFHEGLSEETVYLRFFGTHPHLRPEEAERFTHVDYRDRLALVTEIEDQLVAVARYDRPPSGDRAEVAFVVADRLQGHGVGTLLLEHLAAAARRRGVAAFYAETLGINHPMQEVFQRAGFSTRQRISTGTAHVDFSIAPTDAYLEAVLQRDAFASHARLGASAVPASAGAVGVVCQSQAAAATIAELCHPLGIELSAVLATESFDINTAGALAYMAADVQTKVVLLHADLVGPPAKAVAHARALARRCPVLAHVAGKWSANLCAQAGVELVGGVPSLVQRAGERLAAVENGFWRPLARGTLVDLEGCDVATARAVLDRTGAPAGGRASLEPKVVSDLMSAYGIDPAEGELSQATPTVLLTIDDEGGSAIARARGSLGRVVRMLPLTDEDAAELVGAGVGRDAARLAGPVLRLARMMDDQPDVRRIEAQLGATHLASAVEVWTGPVRDRPDDPFIRRLPSTPEARLEGS